MIISQREIGGYYYYGYLIRKFKCLEIGEEQSKFTDYKGGLYQFYNHDMYFNKLLKNKKYV